MKKFLVLLIVFLFTTSVFALESPWDRKFAFKNGTLIFKTTGSMGSMGSRNGTRIIYFTDYGKKTATYTKATNIIMGMTQLEDDIYFNDYNWEYHIDKVNNVATKNVPIEKYYSQIFYSLSKAQQQKIINVIDKYGWGIVDSPKNKVKKKAVKVLGYWCDLNIAKGDTPDTMDQTVELYLIHNSLLPLKVIIKSKQGSFKEIATSFKKTAPKSKLQIPDLTYTHDTEADRENLEDARKTINRLLAIGGSPKKAYKKPSKPAPRVEQGYLNLSSQQLQELLLLLMEAVDMPQVSESKQQRMTLMMQKIQTGSITPQEQYQTVRMLRNIPLTEEQREQLDEITEMF
jgi:hypothetical protein